MLLALFIFVYIPLSKRKHKKSFQNYCYKKIYSIANYKDYYLINNFIFSIDGVHRTSIDHIMFGNKYIYIIMDKYYEGNLVGKSGDASFIFIDRTGKKQYTDNPFVYSSKLLKKLSGVSGLASDLLIGITLVNDECKLNIENPSKQYYIVQRKDLALLIKEIEKRDVGCLNEKQLSSAVSTMDKINKRNEIKKDPEV